ncbi:MAG: hypothetical protein QW186_07905 [Candidatus Bathyarchaeia archaeon]
MSLQALLDELYKKILEIPTVQEREVIEPEHHNLLKEAVSLLYEIVQQLSQVSALQGWIITWPYIEILPVDYYEGFIPILKYPPYSPYDWRNGYEVTFPSPVVFKNFRVFISDNYAIGTGYVSLVKNEGEAKITIAIPEGGTGWFENTTDTLLIEPGDRFYLETDGSQTYWGPEYYGIYGWAYTHAFLGSQQ